jgi:glycosyltransferase involved in cell wall biosynthesis
MKENNPCISVIIPIYNAYPFLRKCLDSIYNQTLTNFEIIAVNDGSTDKSIEILKEYQTEKKNFILIEKENEGASVARNEGIEKACGEYIAFIDSDDYVDKDFLETLYRLAENNCCDIACCNYYRYTMKTGKRHIHPFYMKTGFYSKQKALNILISDNRIKYYIWNKIFKRSLIINNNIRFSELCFEDTEFCVKTFYFANKIAITKKALYYYTKHKGSTIAGVSVQQVNDYIYALASVRNFLETQNDFKSYSLRYLLHSIKVFNASIKMILQVQGMSIVAFKNIKRLFCAIRYYNSKSFTTVNSIDDLGDIVLDK